MDAYKFGGGTGGGLGGKESFIFQAIAWGLDSSILFHNMQINCSFSRALFK